MKRNEVSVREVANISDGLCEYTYISAYYIPGSIHNRGGRSSYSVIGHTDAPFDEALLI